jgi:hypothetical protein
MSPLDENNIPERMLVRQAAISENARELLREKLMPHVTRATKEFMQARGILGDREDELVKVGMDPFDRVFNIYLKNGGDRDKEEGHFYAYYIWWMRQAVVAYLNSIK